MEPEMALDSVIMTDKNYPSIYHSPFTKSRSVWFQVDLRVTRYVESVYLLFRSDYPLQKFAGRREGIVVRVGNVPARSDRNGNPICGETGKMPDSFLASMTCRISPLGQFIVVKKEHGSLSHWDIDEINTHIL